MGVRYPSVSSNTLVNATVVTTTETVIVTTPPLTLALDFATVLLFWDIALVTGASTTSIVVRLRRGTTVTGTLVNIAQNDTITTASAVRRGGCYFDVPGAVGGQQYSLTVQQNAATANGSITDANLIAFAL